MSKINRIDSLVQNMKATTWCVKTPTELSLEYIELSMKFLKKMNNCNQEELAGEDFKAWSVVVHRTPHAQEGGII